MERDIIAELLAWKESPFRKPLVLRGARQVGKTWALKEFGRRAYKNCAYVTLEETAPGVSSEYAQLFETTKDPRRIASNLSLALGEPIVPGETLLIFDEIQDCPAAIGSLKYFCDDAPEYHVACAGSLLGVKLTRGNSAFPVGKVEFADMGPMTFSEFLRAVDLANLDEYLSSVDSFDPVPNVFHERLSEQLQRYFVTGGMPESVNRWASTHDVSQVDRVLADLLTSYTNDFAKHGGGAQFAKLSLVWRSLPVQLARENKKFIWGLVREGARAREYEDAVSRLVESGLIRKVPLNDARGVPLRAYDSASAFKTYCLDVGLLRRMSGLDATAFAAAPALFSEFKGAFAENYVLQALAPQFDVGPRYWTNEKPRHEVDFLVQLGNDLVPIEVKSGEVVHSASLAYYARKHSDTTPLRVRISARNMAFDGGVLNIPLYLVGRFKELAERALHIQAGQPV